MPIIAVAAALAATATTTTTVVVAVLWRRCRQQLAHAMHQAGTDPLTGLANRRAFTTALDAAVRHGRPVAVALLDVDQLKTVNDRYGHQSGDHILTCVADRLRRLPAPTALAARLSGDEFALLIHADPDAALTAAWSAWHAVASTPVRIAGQPAPVQVSIGLACLRPGITRTQLLHQADVAMYHAKATRTGVYAHHPGMPDQPPAARPALRQRDLPRPRPISPPT